MRVFFYICLFFLSIYLPSNAHAAQITNVVISQTPERLLARHQVMAHASHADYIPSQDRGRSYVVHNLKMFFSNLALVVVQVATVSAVLLLGVLAMQVQTYYKNPRAVMPAQLGITAMCSALLFLVAFVPQSKMPTHVPVERTIVGHYANAS